MRSMRSERIEGHSSTASGATPEPKRPTDLLAAVLGLEIPVESFQKDLRHLNEAFMDLTEQGVR